VRYPGFRDVANGEQVPSAVVGRRILRGSVLDVAYAVINFRLERKGATFVCAGHNQHAVVSLEHDWRSVFGDGNSPGCVHLAQAGSVIAAELRSGAIHAEGDDAAANVIEPDELPAFVLF
jgi:hypothetical protein